MRERTDVYPPRLGDKARLWGFKMEEILTKEVRI